MRLAPRLAALACAAGVAACEPVVAPAPPPAPVPAPAVPVPQPDSAPVAALRAYYAEVQRTLLSRGLMRTDTGARDAPWGARQLAETFLRIALFDEFQATRDGFVAQETASRLRRWSVPVRVSLRFGDSFPLALRATERARVASYLARLQSVTGHPISLTDGPGNFVIAYVNEDERPGLVAAIRAAMPGMTGGEIASFIQMPTSTYCQVSAISEGLTGTTIRAFAVIRSEHPDLLSLACLHEEVAQGLGLPNDSPRARPSVFNDDQEFALLTPMDEAMLGMLYDPRLRPGMTAAEARPIVEVLARERTGGDS
jgi:hypothetical protein